MHADSSPAACRYPYNLDFDYGALDGLNKFSINNLGDPFIESNYGVHSRECEVRLPPPPPPLHPPLHTAAAAHSSSDQQQPAGHHANSVRCGYRCWRGLMIAGAAVPAVAEAAAGWQPVSPGWRALLAAHSC
jgi:hypothetical protein